MNRDDIIRMAIEAGSKFDLGEPHPDMVEVLERFFHMAQAAERNRTWTQDHWTEYERSIAAAEREALRENFRNVLQAEINAAVSAEREACALECWKQMGMIPMQPWTVNPYEECAKAIRARGQQ